MKKILLVGFLLAVFYCNAQSGHYRSTNSARYEGYSEIDTDSRFGVTLGANEYYMDNNFLFSKSNTGFGLGFIATVPVSDNSEVLVEISYNRYRFELMGKENADAESEWVKFYMERINLDVLYDYDVIHFFDGELALGVNAGPVVTFLQNINPADTAKEDYLLEPYGAKAEYLQSEGLALNAYASFGISARYGSFEALLRYNLGLTDPYRSMNIGSSYMNIEGKDDYLGFNLVYYFGQ